MRSKYLPALFVTLCGLLLANPVAAQQELPTGEEVVQKFIKVTGGKEKYAGIKTQVMQAKLAIPESGIAGELTMSFKKGQGVLAEINIEGIGETKRGLSGDVAWETSDLQGPRILSKAETEAMVQESDPSQLLNRDRFKSVKCEGIEEIEGEKCYKVVSTTKDDKEQVEFYSVDSGLVVKSVTKTASPFGEITVESTLSDYREVDGLKLPFKTVQKLSIGVTQQIEITDLKLNVELADEKFALPADVKALQEKK